MKSATEIPVNTDTYDIINQLPMSYAQRTRALATFQRAQAFIEVISHITNVIKSLLNISPAMSQSRRRVAA